MHHLFPVHYQPVPVMVMGALGVERLRSRFGNASRLVGR
jgi:hypothetical protein